MRAAGDRPDPPHAVLLVHCPDRRGIVAALAQLLYGHGANILDADQHTDPVAGQFFQRIRFDLAEIHTDRSPSSARIRETAERFAMRWQLAYASGASGWRSSSRATTTACTTCCCATARASSRARWRWS